MDGLLPLNSAGCSEVECDWHLLTGNMREFRAKLEKRLLQRAGTTVGKKNYQGACNLALERLEALNFIFKWTL